MPRQIVEGLPVLGPPLRDDDSSVAVIHSADLSNAALPPRQLFPVEENDLPFTAEDEHLVTVLFRLVLRHDGLLYLTSSSSRASREVKSLSRPRSAGCSPVSSPH